MPAVMEQIDRMTTGEKFKTMDYIWSSLKNKLDTLSLFNGTALKSDTLPQASSRRGRGMRQERVVRCFATRTAFSRTSESSMFRGEM